MYPAAPRRRRRREVDSPRGEWLSVSSEISNHGGCDSYSVRLPRYEFVDGVGPLISFFCSDKGASVSNDVAPLGVPPSIYATVRHCNGP